MQGDKPYLGNVGLNKETQDTILFPTKIVAGALLLTVLVVAWMGWVIIEASRFAELAKTNFLTFEHLHGKILLYDEVLTMSARMAAATGSKSWIDRYLHYEPLLDRAIKQAIDLSHSNEMAEAARQTDIANVELVGMEHRSFGLVEGGRFEEAQALLSSNTYEEQKTVYAKGMGNLMKQLHDIIIERVSDQQNKNALSIGAVFLLLCITFITWFVVFRSVNQWHTTLSVSIAERAKAEAALSKAHDELEYKIEERTRKLKEEVVERKRAEEKAEYANRAKTEFLANMSHELRTPLNSIIGFSYLMRGQMFGEIGNAKYMEHAKNIHESGNHLLKVINDILDVSRIDIGEAIELSETRIDVDKAIQVCTNMVKERATKALLSLSVDVADGMPQLLADETRVKQTLLNLLTNAIKFTPEKGKIAVSASLDDQRAVLIKVEDNGIGINPEDIPKILEPFQQVEDIMTRSHEGAGLGLPLAKSFMELHGGTLIIDSEVDQGTMVAMRFPPERTVAS